MLPADQPRTARDRRILEALEAADALLRASGGNPYHDADGKFASGPGGGHASPGKHHARNARRRRKLRALRRRHREERREHVRYERSERQSLAREHTRDRKALDREHADRLRRHEATAPARHARVTAEHNAKATRIGKGEQHAHAVRARHERERADFEKTAGDHGHLHAANERLYEGQRKALRDRGGSKEEHEALEQRIAEHREKFKDPHAGLRKSMEERHAKEAARVDAFLAKSGTLKERLNRQTEAKHRRIDRTPARLEKRHGREKAEQEGRHREEREELRERHREERGEIRGRQRDERARVRGKGAKGDGDHGGQRSLGQTGFARSVGRIDGQRSSHRIQGDVHAGRHLDRDSGGPSVDRRLHPNRTHKASSAEAILKHCLRRLGLTAAWRKGELTDQHRLDLLAEIREYARLWLRHEAEQLVRHYGAAVEIARALAGRLRHRVGDFFGRVKVFLKEAIVAGALALSGGELDSEDHAEIERQHAAQVSFLDNFEREVATFRTPPELSEPSGLALIDPLTAAQFAARVEMYGGSVHAGASEIERRRILAHVRKHGIPVREARLHRKPNPEGHACKTCLGESNKGFVPIGTLLPIGDAECLTSCDCYFIYELADGSKFSTLTGLKKAA